MQNPSNWRFGNQRRCHTVYWDQNAQIANARSVRYARTKRWKDRFAAAQVH
uniref:Uncharacterized protein n=1 Tax=Anopheles quadriannulatus TaxID=34691 RepID=A0A182XRQ0_ANOQN